MGCVKTLLKSGTDAKYLLAHLLQKDLAFLEAWPEFPIDRSIQEHFFQLIEKRKQGYPVAYLMGSQPFWSLNLVVNENTLIPRPETEHLVEWALEKLDKDKHYQIVDLGTGSGAVGLAMAKERPNSHIFAVDIDGKALEIARLNAKKLGIMNITFLEGNWYEPLPLGHYDLIVSNPPYIGRQEVDFMSPETHFEPSIALFSEEEGLRDIRLIIEGAKAYLKPGGWLFIEHGFLQGSKVREWLQKADFESVVTRKDYAGLERVSGGA